MSTKISSNTRVAFNNLKNSVLELQDKILLWKEKEAKPLQKSKKTKMR